MIKGNKSAKEFEKTGNFCRITTPADSERSEWLWKLPPVCLQNCFEGNKQMVMAALTEVGTFWWLLRWTAPSSTRAYKDSDLLVWKQTHKERISQTTSSISISSLKQTISSQYHYDRRKAPLSEKRGFQRYFHTSTLFCGKLACALALVPRSDYKIVDPHLYQQVTRSLQLMTAEKAIGFLEHCFQKSKKCWRNGLNMRQPAREKLLWLGSLQRSIASFTRPSWTEGSERRNHEKV